MYVFSIESENFRGLPNLSLRLDKKLNVFVGNNGVGKSSLLDLLTFMISQYRILSDETLSFKPSDVQNGKDDFSCRIVCHLEKSDSYILAKYAVNKTSTSAMYFENKSGSFDDAGSPFGPLHALYDELKEEELPFTKNYPLVVSYPTNRAILEIPERIRGFKPAVHPFDAMDNALSSYLDFRSFIALFRQGEQSLAKRKSLMPDEYSEWLARQVKAVNTAIHKVIPEFGEFHVLYKPFRICIRKNNREYAFLQLSDGEKCLIALLGDLALRLAIANPTLSNPLDGDAIVLIDELELHIHPIWQSRLIDSLQNLFPNAQFIITTHSPMILSNVHPENIWIMSEDGEQPIHPPRSYGMDTSELLSEVMLAETRNTDVRRELERIDRLLLQENFGEARESIRKLAEKTGNIPAVIGLNSDLVMYGQEPVEIED
ncbi:MAG: AAA family ATPase [Desulfovibrionaceae bacterium]|nr:AAA family ATPase [Desulfovibrionaceae bacterium]MBR3663649.1 AAA family ATPase [Desulfovibrio sp.]